MHCFLDWYIWLYLVTCILHTGYVHSKVFVYRNCRKQTEWGLCRLTSQITPLSDIPYKQIGSPLPWNSCCASLFSFHNVNQFCLQTVFFLRCSQKKLQPLKGNVKGQCWLKISTMDIQFLKGLISFVFSFIFGVCLLYFVWIFNFEVLYGSRLPPRAITQLFIPTRCLLSLVSSLRFTLVFIKNS